ncbi:MAG: SulP family inorganic anion transporter [Candidatus Magasanikbacteria bacterium]|nr:SulP family inorganic anion transporter [Candidatus Magasanikbacteria bacterium]
MILKKLKENWKSGLTVSLVSIPLSISLAVASGASPIDGIVTAIWAGLIAALFGGSNFNIVGPTGALSGVLATYAIVHGADKLSVLAIAAGVIILAAFALKLEKYLVFIPGSAIHGFTLGVAFIIAFNEFNFATGLHGLPGHERFIDNLFESFRHVGQTSFIAVGIFAIFLLGLFAFAKYAPKIPGAIALSPFGVLLGYLSTTGHLPFALQTLETRFGNLTPVLFQARSFTFDSTIIIPAFTVALVAILETMLSAKIGDTMTGTKHNKRREMLGLGLANIGSGLFGGIPATAALARTSLNIKSGATDKMSGVVNAVSIAVISFILLSGFKFMPLPVIAAILVYVALRMIEVRHFSTMYAFNRMDFALSILVAFITVYEDPITGILFGTAAALLIFVDKLSRGQFELTANHADKEIEREFGEERAFVNAGAQTLVYSIKGQLAYLNAGAHIDRFDRDLNGYKTIVLRLRELYLMDLDGVEAFNEIVHHIEHQGREVYVTGVSPLISDALNTSKVYQRLHHEGHVLEKTSDVLTKLGFERK